MSKLSVCRCVIETIINTSITKLDDRIQITQSVGEGRISYSTHEESIDKNFGFETKMEYKKKIIKRI